MDVALQVSCERHVPHFSSCASTSKRGDEPFWCSTSSLGDTFSLITFIYLCNVNIFSTKEMSISENVTMLVSDLFSIMLSKDSETMNYVFFPSFFTFVNMTMFLNYHTCMYQLYSSGSNRCAEFSKSWNKIGMHNLITNSLLGYIFSCAIQFSFYELS